ncbi:MAG: aspartate aminotransferase family protein [Clostridia bacterium]|nr:aspartate aminotransferase family protein [Clostridia bacterium]
MPREDVRAAPRLPEEGLSDDLVLARARELMRDDLETGRVFAYVYDAARPRVRELAERVAEPFRELNALDFTVFPSLLRLENEVVGMTASLFHPGPDTVGTFTSGGTESILLAVKAARDRFRARRGEGAPAEIVMPVTAHAAFHKAAHYLGLTPVVLACDPTTFRVDPDDVRRAIGPRTAIVVASAVNYSHGVSDPIPEIGAIAAEGDVWFHVDACIGGFLLAYFERLGEPVVPFDFRVPGVSSLSVDLHKYGFAPKGSSVLLYRDRSLRRYQYFASTRWSGYPVVNATVQSTKSGGPLAGSWATLLSIGDRGYLQIAREVLAARRELERRVPEAAGLTLLGRPEAGLVAFTSESVNLFVLADRMRSRGWYIQPQPGRPEHELPPSVHLTVTPGTARRQEEFLADLAQAAAEAEGAPDPPFVRQLVEALKAQAAAGAAPVEALARWLPLLGLGPAGLPEEMAEIHALMRHLPPEWTEALLVEVVNGLFG